MSGLPGPDGVAAEVRRLGVGPWLYDASRGPIAASEFTLLVYADPDAAIAAAEIRGVEGYDCYPGQRAEER